MQRDRDGGSTFHHMVVGDHIAIFRDDKTGAGRSSGGRLTEQIGTGHRRGDQHHGLHILLVDRAGRCDCSHNIGIADNRILFGRSRIDLLLHLVQAVFKGIDHHIGSGFPLVVDHMSRHAAAAGHQCDRQYRTQNRFPHLAAIFASALLYLAGHVLRRDGGNVGIFITVRLGLRLIHHIGRIRKRRLFASHTHATISLLLRLGAICLLLSLLRFLFLNFRFLTELILFKVFHRSSSFGFFLHHNCHL